MKSINDPIPEKYNPKDNQLLLLKYLKEVHNKETTFDELFNLSSTGELWHIFELGRAAVNHYYPMKPSCVVEAE